MRFLVLLALAALLLSGCRFREPAPSEAVYMEGVAETEMRPPIELKRAAPDPNPEPVVLPVAVPGPVEPAAVTPAEVVKTAPLHVICFGHQGALDTIGGTVRALGDWIQNAKAPGNDEAGVILDATGPDTWRVCMATREAVAGTQVLEGREVVRLTHRGAFWSVDKRAPELDAWLKANGRSPTGPLRLILLDDPESTPEPKLRSSLEYPL